MKSLQLIRGGRDLDTGIQIAQLRKLVIDLFPYNRWIYWTDFSLCALLGYGFFALAMRPEATIPEMILLLLVASFALYRGLLFIHEIAHFRKESVPGFTYAWNFVFGLPFFVPSVMYQGVHLDHHSKNIYGTPEDGEYVPFVNEGPGRISLYLLTVFVSPLLLYIRYTLIAPISFIAPGFRKVVLTQLSSLVIDFEYIRGALTASERKNFTWQEPTAALYGLILTVALVQGWLPLRFIPSFYGVTVFMFLVNSLRTLAAHRYANAKDPITVVEQLQDSVNIASQSLLNRLLCPVGLRFHALHHLFPTMPYHSLEAAHARIMRNVPADSLYHTVNEPSLSAALRCLWRAAKSHQSQRVTKEKTSLIPQFKQTKRSLSMTALDQKLPKRQPIKTSVSDTEPR